MASYGKGADLEGASIEWLEWIRQAEQAGQKRTNAVLAVGANNLLDELQGAYQKLIRSGGENNAATAKQLGARVANIADKLGDLIGPDAKKGLIDDMKADLVEAQKQGIDAGIDLDKILNDRPEALKANAKPNMPAIEAAGLRLNDFWAKENTNFRDRVRALTQTAAAQGKSWRQLSLQIRELLTLEQQQGTESKRSERLRQRMGVAGRADLIARTELAYAYIEGQKASYRNMGYEHGRWSAASERTCGYCISRDGLIYTLDDLEFAIPAHPRCRCTVIPVKVPPSKEGVTAEDAATRMDDVFWSRARKEKLDSWKQRENYRFNTDTGKYDIPRQVLKSNSELDQALRQFADTPTNSQNYFRPGEPAPKAFWAPSGKLIPDVANAVKALETALEAEKVAAAEKAKAEAEAAAAQKALEEAEAKLKAEEEAAEQELLKQGLGSIVYKEAAAKWKDLTPEERAEYLKKVDIELKNYAGTVMGLTGAAIDQLTTAQKLKVIDAADNALIKLAQKATGNTYDEGDIAFLKKQRLGNKRALFEQHNATIKHAAAVKKAEEEKAKLEAEAKAKAAAEAQKALEDDLAKKWTTAPKDGMSTNELIALANKWNMADADGKQKILNDLYRKAGKPTPKEGPLRKLAKKLTAEADEAYTKWKAAEADSIQAQLELDEAEKLLLLTQKNLSATGGKIDALKKEVEQAKNYIKKLEESRALAEERLGNLTKRHQAAMDDALKLAQKVKELEGQRTTTVADGDDDLDGYNKAIAKDVHSEESLRTVAEDVLKRAGLKGIDDLIASGESAKLIEESNFLRRQIKTRQSSLDSLEKAWAREEKKFLKAIAEQEAKGPSAAKYAALNKKSLESNREWFNERKTELLKSIEDNSAELKGIEAKLAKTGQAGDPKAAAKAVISQLLKTSPITREQAELLVKEVASVATRKKLADRNQLKSPKNVSDLSAMTDAVHMFGGRLTMDAYATLRDRAHAGMRGDLTVGMSNSLMGLVNAGSKDSYKFRQTQFHELAHHLEFTSADIYTSARGFIERRARAAQPNGSLVSTRLSILDPKRQYGPDEYAFPGKAIDAYVLKDYRRFLESAYGKSSLPTHKQALQAALADKSGSRWQKLGDATEVISMGVEHLADPDLVMQLAKADPEHLLLAIGAVRVAQARQAQVLSAKGEVKITWADDVADMKRATAKTVARLGAGKKKSPEQLKALEDEIKETTRLMKRAEMKANKLTEELNEMDIVLKQTNEMLAKAPSPFEAEKKLADLQSEFDFLDGQRQDLVKALVKVSKKQKEAKAKTEQLEADYKAADKKAAAVMKKAEQRDEGLKSMKDSLAKVEESTLDDILISQGAKPEDFESKAHKVDEIYAIEGGAQPAMKGAMKPSAVLSALQGNKPAATAPAPAPKPEAAPKAAATNYAKKPLKELQSIAKAQGLKGYSKLAKGELVSLLEGSGGAAAPAAVAKVTLKPIKTAELDPVPYSPAKVDFVGKRMIVNGEELVQGPTLAGSTRPVLFQNSEGVGRYVVKRAGSDGQDDAEFTAQRIYNRMANTEVRGVNSHLVGEDFNKRLVNEFVKGARTIGSLTSAEMRSLDINRKIRSTHMTDALLANWDYVGLSNDNIMVGADGKLYKIDAGGTFNYRAQGKLKAYQALPEEIFSLRNGQGAKAWAKATEGDLKHLWQKQTGDMAAAAADLKGILQGSGMGHLSKEFGARLDYIVKAHKVTTQTKYDGKTVDELVDDGVLKWKDIDQAMEKAMASMRGKQVDKDWGDLVEFAMENAIGQKVAEGQARASRLASGGGILDMKTQSLKEQRGIRGTADHQTGLWGTKRNIRASSSPEVVQAIQEQMEKVYGKAFDTDDVIERMETVRAYTGSSYGKMIATQLKVNKPEAFADMPKWIQDLAGGTAYYNKTQRGQELVQALPAWEGGKLMRGMKFGDAEARMRHIDLLTNGKPVGSLLSWSSDRYKADGFDGGSFGLKMHVENPQGFSSVMGLSNFQSEYEALAHQDQRLRVVKITTDEEGLKPVDAETAKTLGVNKLHVWLEELDPS